MIRWFIHRQIDRQEKILGESLDYARHILDTSLKAFMKFAKIMPFAAYRRKLPADAASIAHLVAARDEDCGTCVQIAINVAIAEGINPDWLQAALDDRSDGLPAELAEVYRFADHVVRNTGQESELRETLRERYGDEALIELALAISGSRVYPMVKRVLGYAKSCAVAKPHVPGKELSSAAN